MIRRFSAVVLAALVLVPSAAAVRVHVRVEGAKTTILGTTAPLVNVQANALDALEAASGIGEFYYHVQHTSFGPYVDQIGRYAGAGRSGWVFKVDGKSPPVGADAVTLKDGDTVLWYWAQFGAAGGPKTLALERGGRRAAIASTRRTTTACAPPRSARCCTSGGPASCRRRARRRPRSAASASIAASSARRSPARFGRTR